MLEVSDASGYRRVLDVHVEDRQENGNSPTSASHEGLFSRFLDDINRPVRGRKIDAHVPWHLRLWVTEETQSKHEENQPNPRQAHSHRRQKPPGEERPGPDHQ